MAVQAWVKLPLVQILMVVANILVGFTTGADLGGSSKY